MFVARIVRRERLGHAHRGDTGSTEPVERTPDVGHRQPIGHVEERTVHLEALARSDLDVAQGRPLLDPLEVGATAHPDDAHRRRVTLDQRVHRLSGGVRDEIDVVRPDLFGEFRDGLHHTSRDPTRGRVRRRHHHGGDDRSTREFDGDSFRERSTDVDPDANSGHTEAVAACCGAT